MIKRKVILDRRIRSNRVRVESWVVWEGSLAVTRDPALDRYVALTDYED
jgi:hypothetical protein